MDLVCQERPSDSPFIERILRSQSDYVGSFVSMADVHFALVVTKCKGQTTLTVRGPETKASPADTQADSEILGIVFKPGVFMRNLPPKTVMDRRDFNLPEATNETFWLSSSVWQYPNYENADIFVHRLMQDGLLVYDPVVQAALKGEPVDMSLRTVQRRVLQATGLTQNAIYQIGRARYATTLLKQGKPILDTVSQAGYFDQPHLTRSLKHFIGLTPAQVINNDRPERLSFLYKTEPIGQGTIIPARGELNEKNHRAYIRVP
jgi:AraC-like DNA-binding protein